MSCVKGHKGFTLTEVLVATAIAGMTITAGFKLIAMSYKLMAELQIERELIAAAQHIWLRFRIDKDMADSGTDDKNNIRWSSERESIPVDEGYDLKFRRVTVTIGDGRSTVIYVAE